MYFDLTRAGLEIFFTFTVRNYVTYKQIFHIALQDEQIF